MFKVDFEILKHTDAYLYSSLVHVAPVSLAMNVYISACSSITISVDLPAPWPALTSIRPRIGFGELVTVSFK